MLPREGAAVRYSVAVPVERLLAWARAVGGGVGLDDAMDEMRAVASCPDATSTIS